MRRDAFLDMLEQFLGGLSIDASSTIRLPFAASSVSIASWRMVEESMISRQHQQTDGSIMSRPRVGMLDENEEP